MELRNLIRDFVFGMEDGLVSNLGLVLGVYFGGGGPFAVVLAGLASMVAGAFSMAAGSYLSAKSQREVYEQEIHTTKEDLLQNPKRCLREMKRVLRKEGLSSQQLSALFNTSSSVDHPEFVCNYLVQRKVGISHEKLDHPVQNSLVMFFSFFVGSLFPVVPFLFWENSLAVYVATIITIVALFAMGVAKTRYTQRSWYKSGMEIVIVGLIAGIIGYGVGWLVGVVG